MAVGNFMDFKLCELGIYAVGTNLCCTSSVTCTYMNKFSQPNNRYEQWKKKKSDNKLRFLNSTCHFISDNHICYDQVIL